MSTRLLLRQVLKPPRTSILRPLHTSNNTSIQRFTRKRLPVRRPPSSSWTSPGGGSNVAKHPHDESSALSNSASAAVPPPTTKSVIEAETDASPELPPASRLPVNVPEDPQGIIDRSTSSASERVKELFSVPAIVVSRQLEMMSIMIGYEQANRYQLQSPDGQVLGYLLEEDQTIGKAITRQMLKTHRPFKATVLDIDGNVILTIKRGFTWINSKIQVLLPDDETGQDRLIGEAQQEWHLYRRRYNMFVNREDEGMDQFGKIDAGFLAWDFTVVDEENKAIGSINRNFQGFAKEIFADAGQYVLRFEGVFDELNAAGALPSPVNDAQLPAPSGSVSTPLNVNPSTASSADSNKTTDLAKTENSLTSSTKEEQAGDPSSLDLALLPAITFDQRAVMLASAISCDFDYFSRHSGSGGMMGPGMWMPMPMGGTTTTNDGVGGVEGGEVEGEGSSGTGDDGPLPSSGEDDLPVNRDSGGWSEEPTSQGVNGWGDEPMNDPWSQPQQEVESGGTWGWSDLFPGDD